MLSKWMSGEGNKEGKDAAPELSKEEQQAAARKAALEADPEVAPELSDDEKEEQRNKDIRAKLREAAKEGNHGHNPNSMIAYDSLFRNVSRVLMDGQASQEMHDGLQINMQRQGAMSMVSSKWAFGNPKAAHWEAAVAMSGFNDMMNVSYNTLGRWQLMYQRMFLSGAVGVLQFMAQPQMMAMGAPGTLFAMLQYPWVKGGCTQFQYVRSQQFSVSHAQRLIRGVYAGAQISYENTTNATNMSYSLSSQSNDKSANFACEYKDNGEWKLGMTKSSWETDSEFGAMLDYTESKENGFQSSLTFGIKKNLIGGGSVNAVLSGFKQLKANLELPFGGDRQGVNQVRLNYMVQYGIGSGGLKHGITISL